MNQPAGAGGGGGPPPMAKKALHIWVRPRMENGKLEWDVDDNPEPAEKYKKVVSLEDGSGPRRIVFHLHDPDGLDLMFDCANPIYAEDNVACPPAQALNSGQITKISCSQNTLTIRNENSDKARLIRYQLNFRYTDNTIADPCDPVILNGGGGGEDP